MATVNQITQNIIAQARLLDPNISLEIGTPERKIVEAVAESIASASVDIEVLSGQLYLDELSGARIDSFLSLFGFGRQLGSRATGVVTVSRDSVATYDATIPKGTQFSTRAGNGIPNLIFIATETVVLRANETRALVRVECTTSGTVGNIPAGTIDGLPNSINIPGVSRVVNETATSGGIDTETDEKFKTRFQNTIFRNMAGTSDQHYALALSHPSVSKANVIGPQSRYTEYLQVPAVADQLSVTGPTGPTGPTNPYYPGNTYTTSISSVPYSKYTFSNNYYVAKGTGKNAKFLRPGKDFILNNPASLVNGAADQSVVGNPVPNITLFGDSTTVDGTLIQFPEEILLFEHTYLSRASRNDWSRNIYNCIDVYVNGELPQAASSEESFPSLTMQFVNDSESVAYYRNYVRVVTNEIPALGNRLHVLYFQPVVGLIGSSLTINEQVYKEASYVHPNDETKAWTTRVYYDSETGAYYQDEDYTTPGEEAHYFLIKDVSTNAGTVRARDGIEWLASVGTPGSNTFNVDYYFDLAISQLQAVMERSKQITTDVLVHSTKYQYFKLYITVMYTPGFTEENVNLQIYSSLLNFFNTQYYGTTIQMSDLLQAIHNTSGVDNVRWTYPEPAAGEHKIEVVTKAGVSFSEPIYQDGDFILNDDELPSLPDIANGDALANALVIERKAQNTWETS
jgi:uncharacterized phage protein gp47/JayE